MARILVIDDDVSVRSMFETLLPLEGYEVVTVADGDKAVAAASSEAYDMILTDLVLPDMNGYQVLRLIRHAGPNATTPVVVVTALVDPEGEDAEQDLGVVLHLEKPFDIDHLEHVIADAVAPRRSA